MTPRAIGITTAARFPLPMVMVRFINGLMGVQVRPHPGQPEAYGLKAIPTTQTYSGSKRGLRRRQRGSRAERGEDGRCRNAGNRSQEPELRIQKFGRRMDPQCVGVKSFDKMAAMIFNYEQIQVLK